MNIILGALLIITGITFLVVIGFGITLLLGITSKKQTARSVGKFGLFISGGIFLGMLLGTGIYNGIYHHQLKVEEQEKSAMNTAFRKESKKYKSNYILTAIEAENLGNKEKKSWGDAITKSSRNNDDFNVDRTVSNILDDNASAIKRCKNSLEKTKKLLDKLSENDTGEYSYKEYADSYAELRRMVNLITSPSGSYSTFSNKFSDLDDKVSEVYESL